MRDRAFHLTEALETARHYTNGLSKAQTQMLTIAHSNADVTESLLTILTNQIEEKLEELKIFDGVALLTSHTFSHSYLYSHIKQLMSENKVRRRGHRAKYVYSTQP